MVDGISMRAVAESLVRHGSFAVAEGLGPLGGSPCGWAVWWWMLPAARIPRWIGALVATLMAGAGLAMLRSVYLARERVT